MNNEIQIESAQQLLEIVKKPNVSHALASKLTMAYYGCSIDLSENKKQVIDAIQRAINNKVDRMIMIVNPLFDE